MAFSQAITRIFVALTVALSLLHSKAEATRGVDVSQPVSITAFKCLKEAGYDFVIVRAYQSLGHPDPNARHTVANAHAAGIKNVDVYLFPCPRCSKSAEAQVKEMVGALNISYGQIWLDIEGSQYWTSSFSENQKFFELLLSTAKKYKTTAVYTSQSQWDPIMGSGYSGGSGEQLWYAHYDGVPSFSDFKSFGGWSKPAIKQFAGNAEQCGVGIDKNFY